MCVVNASFRGLYLHLPFCARKCPYCGFFVLAGGHQFHEDYARALIREFEARRGPWGSRFHTLYLGGGTPSLWPPRLLAWLLERLTPFLEPGAEITVELNPEHGTRDLLETLRAAGVNRLSIGAQSGRVPELRFLGRQHAPAEVAHTVDRARRAGFENLNLDLIFGLPGQRLQDLEQSLAWAVSLEPEHLSVYSLTLEPGTLFWREARRGRLSLPPEETLARMFQLREAFLEAHGYRLYEISNFARPGFESRHNLVYWCHQPYLGLGLSAASFRYLDAYTGERWTQHRSLVRYLRGEFQAQREVLEARALLLERVFLGIRLRTGIRWPLDRVPPEIQPLVHLQEGVLRLTPRGRLVADRLALELVTLLEQTGRSPEDLLQAVRSPGCLSPPPAGV